MAKALPAPGTGRLGTGSCRASNKDMEGGQRLANPAQAHHGIRASAGLLPAACGPSSALLWRTGAPCRAWLNTGWELLVPPGRPPGITRYLGSASLLEQVSFQRIWTVRTFKAAGRASQGLRRCRQPLEEPPPPWGHRLLGRECCAPSAALRSPADGSVAAPRDTAQLSQQKEGFLSPDLGRVFCLFV